MAADDSAISNLTLKREGPIGFVCGILIGIAAGMIGVGGGEFRIPVLLHVLKLPVRIAAGVNMVIGLAVVVLGVLRRWSTLQSAADYTALVAVMIVTSLIGAWIGAHFANRLPVKPLKIFVIVYLTIVGIWMIFEAVHHVDHAFFNPVGTTRLVIAGSVSFVIAAISGSLGIAGGEMRIPALIYLFAVPIKDAGTLSLMVSIPTVASGAAAYRRMGHIPNRALGVSLIMGLGSILGVLIGAALLPYVDKHVLKGILGALLLLATLCLTLPWLIYGSVQRETCEK